MSLTAATALFVALIVGALAARAEALVYWANLESNTIGRANLDGTGVDQMFITGVGGPTGVEVDAQHVYWSNQDTNTIGRANLDGTGVDQTFITGARRPSGIAVDTSHIYWVNTTSNTIGRANLDGTGVDQYFMFGVGQPRGPAVDGAHLYWANLADGALPFGIGRANLDGTGIEPSFIHFSPFLVEPTIPLGVAVDGGHLYWANVGDSVSNGTIGRASLNGTGVERDFITGVGGPGAVAVDGGHIYWVNVQTFAHPGAIGRASIDGTGVDQSFITGEQNVTGVAVDALSAPPPAPAPSNEFSVGKPRKNERKGTAKLTVTVPGPGKLNLAKTKQVKPDHKIAEAAGEQTLIVRPRHAARKKLNARGKAKVKVDVTYAPDGGEPNVESKKLKLVKR